MGSALAVLALLGQLLHGGLQQQRIGYSAQGRPIDVYAVGSGSNKDGGGPEPLSEPETVDLADFIAAASPKAVLSYHSAGSIVMGGPVAHEEGLIQAYVAAASSYVDLDWSLYPVTGDFAQWLEEQGI